MRPILPDQSNAAFRSAPNFSPMLPHLRQPNTSSPLHGNNANKRNPSINNPNMDIVSDIGDNQAIGGGYVGAIPASFATQVFNANQARKQRDERNDEQDRISRLMMSRLTNLEESMREVIHGVRDMAHGGSAASGSASRQRSPERIVRVAKRATGAGNNGPGRSDSYKDRRKIGSREGEKAKGDQESVASADVLTQSERGGVAIAARPDAALLDQRLRNAAEAVASPLTVNTDKENVDPTGDGATEQGPQDVSAKAGQAVEVSDFAPQSPNSVRHVGDSPLRQEGASGDVSSQRN
ncbi:uncharacterized protein AB675_4699 [Cyphellophora attinorum]|uniref:Uncharacterized protein n=1 Tax=Cyphellophora attinorum TaxID=1664694 RepID=A0A0N1H7P1_9EURO|nr:uncharacterized protein AB675_4699 [Phialophora attinorum]KPI39095.1 hypothetical protein AB675_4699 [Phialophora attinorum]